MLELPRGLWKWLASNERNLARIAKSLEKVTEEITRIRRVMEDDEEDGRQ